MIPTFKYAVTLLRRTATGFATVNLTDCTWSSQIVRNASDNSATDKIEVTCRVPYGQTAPAIGDVLVKGTVTATITSEIELNRKLSELRKSGYEAFKVTNIADNTSFALARHYKAVGT